MSERDPTRTADAEPNADTAAVAADAELDATGLYCPEPVMMLHNKMRELSAGQVLRIQATDPSTTRDVPKFCLYLGHELLEETQRDDKYFYLIRKKAD